MQDRGLTPSHQIRSDIWASPLVADGKVYIASQRGELLVFAAQREKKLITALDLAEPISSTPMAANGVLYVTTHSKLFALQ